MRKPLLTLAALPSESWLRAALPLIEAGEVEALEWSFDCCWDGTHAPGWLKELLDYYESRDRLFGHGVRYSILTINSGQHETWLRDFRDECRSRRYQHITEHFGIMGTGDFHGGAPLPVPYDPDLARIAGKRLLELKQISGCPVGLENLALSFSKDEVRAHSKFIGEIIEPSAGFFLLDLHNLYCQSCNFGISIDELCSMYPAERVLELHISGGSWSESSVGNDPGRIRRDTHDNAVPQELFEFLPEALQRLPNLAAVTFEQIGESLATVEAQRQFQDDFHHLKGILENGKA